MDRKLMKALKLLLSAALVVALAVVLWRQVEYAEGGTEYEAAAALAGVPELAAASPVPEPSATPAPTLEPTEAPEEAVETPDPNLALLEAVDLPALQEVNSQVLGWIAIPGTELSYPLVQGTDNQHYLNYTWQGQRNGVGAIFMDYRSDGGLGDFYTLIYGHRMRDTSMFGSLAGYEKEEYWRAHPSVYLAHEGGVYRYDIFAAFQTDVYSDVYRLSFPEAADREAFLAWCLEQSVIHTDTVPSPDGRIVTLSTCTENGRATRWVVMAALADPVETA